MKNAVDYWYQKYLKEKLTWEDIQQILFTERQVMREVRTMDANNEELCKEVLHRFITWKENEKE